MSGLAKKNLGSAGELKVFSAPELIKKFGQRTAIMRLVQKGELVALGAGFYATNAIDPWVALVHVVAKYYPRAVISGVSALFIHGLSDILTDKVYIDVPSGMRLRNRLIQTRRIVKSRMVGVQTLSYHGADIRIYDVERSLADAYRIDRYALFYKAFKRYMKKYKPNPDRIQQYDRLLGTKVLSALRQEFADE